jgi:hypothetical protein
MIQDDSEHEMLSTSPKYPLKVSDQQAENEIVSLALLNRNLNRCRVNVPFRMFFCGAVHQMV